MCKLPVNAELLHKHHQDQQPQDENSPSTSIILKTTEKKTPKSFLPTNAILKKNEILQDLYNNAL